MFGRPSDNNPRINFVTEDAPHTLRHPSTLVAAIFTISITVIVALTANSIYRAATRGTSVLTEMSHIPVISHIGQVFGFPVDNTLPSMHAGPINVLILGIGGDGHDGGLLTDTIILASVDLSTKRVNLLSIPRDLAYPLEGGGIERINSIHAYAELTHPGEGIARTSEAISKLLDVPIDHVIRLDFGGFANLVDAVGGIDVLVERSFTDPLYPTKNDAWTTISFKKGRQHMDGSTALMYVRSRHGDNQEGSDFARSRRQHIVLQALREKLLSLGTLTDPQKLATLYSTISRHIQSDLTIWDMIHFAPLIQDFSTEKMTMRVLTDAPDGPLVAANIRGAFMLMPRKPDWTEIRDIAQHPFADPISNESTSSSVGVVPARKPELVQLQIKNGTTRTNFAAQVSAKLERGGFEITSLGNALRKGYERTTIYDLTQGKHPQELQRLKKLLDADISITDLPTLKKIAAKSPASDGALSIIREPLDPEADVLIILGENSFSFIQSSLYVRQTGS